VLGLEASAALQQLLVRWAELTVFNCIAHNHLCLEFSVQLNLSPSRVDSSIDCYTVVNRLTPKQSMLMSQPQSNHMQADDGLYCDNVLSKEHSCNFRNRVGVASVRDVIPGNRA